MAVNTLIKRELYVDVVVKEDVLEEIFLYQVDFLHDHSFRTKEYVFHVEEQPEQTEEAPILEEAEETEPVDITELFREQWEALLETEVLVDVFATDAKLVLDFLFLELLKKYPEMPLRTPKGTKKEFMHDFISMGRVTSMSFFDEQQHLSAGIRRRMKERYHDCVDEVKKERSEHIFMRRMPAGSPYELELFVTDADYRIRKNILLPKAANEETLTLKLVEILTQHADADLIVDKVSVSFYQLLNNIASFIAIGTVPPVFSLESMFYSAGKIMPSKELVENYVQYIRNLEDIRFGRFVSDTVHSVHTFYLPVKLSGEKDWKKQFKKNTMWKENGEDAYVIRTDEGLKGKYIIKAGKEQFALRLKSVSLKKYLGDYAVLRMEAENHCYPGDMDKERINFLASHLFSDVTGQGPDCVELKLKAEGQAYSLTTVRYEGNEDQLWLNGLLALGRVKKSKKHALVLHALTENMYCTQSGETEKEEEIVRTALLRDGILREIERRLVICAAPEKKSPFGRLTKKQRKQIRALYGRYRYLIVSFGEEYKNGPKNYRQVFSEAEEKVATADVIGRLKEKFDLFFA